MLYTRKVWDLEWSPIFQQQAEFSDWQWSVSRESSRGQVETIRVPPPYRNRNLKEQHIAREKCRNCCCLKDLKDRGTVVLRIASFISLVWLVQEADGS